MSFKLRPEWGSLPAEMKDGVITVDDGIIEDVEVSKFLKGLTFNKQSNNFVNKSIQCLLKNEKYIFILRFDGSYTVYMADTKCICANQASTTNHKPLYIYDVESRPVVNGGLIVSPDKNVMCGCHLVQLRNNRIILFCDASSMVGNNVSRNSYYYRYCLSNKNNTMPKLLLNKDGNLTMDTLAGTMVEVDNYYNTTPGYNVTPERMVD